MTAKTITDKIKSILVLKEILGKLERKSDTKC